MPRTHGYSMLPLLGYLAPLAAYGFEIFVAVFLVRLVALATFPLMTLLALATQPELLVLDEPLEGLDPAAREQMIDLLGVRLDLRTIKLPTYMLSTREDHIAPAKSVKLL